MKNYLGGKRLRDCGDEMKKCPECGAKKLVGRAKEEHEWYGIAEPFVAFKCDSWSCGESFFTHESEQCLTNQRDQLKKIDTRLAKYRSKDGLAVLNTLRKENKPMNNAEINKLLPQLDYHYDYDNQPFPMPPSLRVTTKELRGLQILRGKSDEYSHNVYNIFIIKSRTFLYNSDSGWTFNIPQSTKDKVFNVLIEDIETSNEKRINNMKEWEKSNG